MKNRKKALIIAIICLAAAAVLYLLVVKLSQRSEDADSSDDSLVISSVDSGQITAISYEKDGKSLSFRKEAGTWYGLKCVFCLYRRFTAPCIMRRTRVFRLTRTA